MDFRRVSRNPSVWTWLSILLFSSAIILYVINLYGPCFNECNLNIYEELQETREMLEGCGDSGVIRTRLKKCQEELRRRDELDDKYIPGAQNSKLQIEFLALNQSYHELKTYLRTREKTCGLIANSLDGTVTLEEQFKRKVRTLEEKDRTNQAIIDNLRSSLLKSNYHNSRDWRAKEIEKTTTERKVSIYVYNMPRFNTDFYYAHLSEYQKKCRNQIGERELHQRFLDSPNRVMDGELADLYYVPVYTGCYRTVVGTELQTDAYSATYKFISDAVDLIKKNYPYWERSQGRDHVWLFLYDYGVCLEYGRPNAKLRRIPSGLENSILIQYLGDITPGMECFSTWKDVVIPAFVNNPKILAGRGGVTIDPASRHTFAYFRGSIRWKLSKWHTAEMNYSNGVREIINRTYYNDDLFELHQGASPNYIEEMQSSVFCLAPLGYALWNFRLYESVLLGCIPVIIADNIELPYESVIDYRQFTVKILETQVSNLKDILLSIPKEDIRKKQEMLKKVWKRFAYMSPTEEGDAFDLLINELGTHANRPYQPAAKTYWL
eukprot:m.337322 g.337322  ORF g.337322 m.337322 type:complete len:550 (+) comp18101_c0_seq1:164-1813(+)